MLLEELARSHAHVIKGETCRHSKRVSHLSPGSHRRLDRPDRRRRCPRVDALGVMASTIASVPADFVLRRGPPGRRAAAIAIREARVRSNPQHRELIHLALVRVPSRSRLGLARTDSGAEFLPRLGFEHAIRSGGATMVHAPHVLYHWRSHDASSSHRETQNPGPWFQRAVLERVVADNLHTLAEVAEYPIDRGAIEWWIRRRPIDPPSFGVVILGGNGRSSTEPIAGDLTLHKPWSRPRANRNS